MGEFRNSVRWGTLILKDLDGKFMEETSKYEVVWSGYSYRHYKKKFFKDYPGRWGPTEASINQELERLPRPVLPQTAYVIKQDDEGFVAKIDFAVSGTNQSRHGSGNRAIVHGDYESGVISVMLVYHKSQADKSGETVWWKSVIAAQFPEVAARYC